MANNYVFNDFLPVAPLRLAVLGSRRELVTQVNGYTVELRRNDIEELLRRKMDSNYRGYDVDSYLLRLVCLCFGTDEARGHTMESVYGADVSVMMDVTDYSISYTVSGYTNHMSPDDHSQNLKKVIGAGMVTTHRANAVMPLLYEGKQHKGSEREFLDHAMALGELARMDASSIITPDAHDPQVQNMILLDGLDNFMPTYQLMKTLSRHDTILQTGKDHLMVISPGEEVMDWAVHLANNLSVDMDMFYKRGDYLRIIDGRNSIVAHEFLGSSVEGKTVLITDNVISSGENMLDIAKELKEHETSKMITCCAFGLFTNGPAKFDEFYERGCIDYVITTSLNHRPGELLTRE